MSEKSIVQEARDIQLAMELITLGARGDAANLLI